MNSPVFAHPLLQPTQSPPRTSLLDTYDPTVSPNRPLSPRSTATLFPNSSIIAVNPLTGRPVLPHLPVLPGRLKLSDSDDEGLEVVETGRTGEPEHGDPSRSYESYTHSPTADADYAHQAAMAAAAAEAEAEAEADEERRTRERIERMLKDMMARQRARVKHTSPAATNIPAPPPRRSRICRRAQARTRLQRQPSPDIDPDLEVDPTGYRMEHRDDEAHSPTYPEPDVDAESDAEKEELMSLITASLRKEVTRADEEAWMFGDPGGIDPTFD